MTTETPQHVLGRQVAYPDHYAPEILVRVDRAGNREAHAIDTHNLPFTGYDLWNTYEVSALTRNGAPVNLIMRLRYPCESRYIVESKSLKLYLNAFNMTRLDATPDEVACTVARTVERDLSALLETRVEAVVETPRRAAAHTLTSPEAPDSAPTAWACWDANDLSGAPLTAYKEEPALLHDDGAGYGVLQGMTDLLRSRCKITSQPDWGDLYLYMRGNRRPSVDSLLRYIVSFRDENHFHEEVVEMIYHALWTRFAPEELLVMAFYTRRGGIDINPARASHADLLTRFCPHITAFERIAVKTPRQ